MIKLFVRREAYEALAKARPSTYLAEIAAIVVSRRGDGVFFNVDSSVYGLLRMKYTGMQTARWGPRAWGHLHTMVDPTPEKFEAWKSMILCADCLTATENLVAEHAMGYNSPETFFESTVWLHDAVNGKRGIPPFGIEKARRAWQTI